MRTTPSSLQLNPMACIGIHSDKQTPVFRIEAPIKGAAYSTVDVDAESLPGAYAFLRATLIDGNKDPQIDRQTANELSQIGLFVIAEAIPRPVRYPFPACRSTAGRLLGRAAVEALSDGQARQLSLPPDWSESELGFVAHHHCSVWAPVQVNPGTASLAEQPSADDWPFASALDTAATRAQFDAEGFVVLDQLLPDDQITALGRYFQALADEGYLPCVNENGTRRFVAHNHPVARFWHLQLNQRVAQLAGRATKASYCYVSLYIGGELRWHKDRPPCEYTIALLLSCAPLDTEDRSPWALKIKARDQSVRAIHQRVGDALLFKGRELPHSREQLPHGHRSASLLFHFVDQEYDGEMG